MILLPLTDKGILDVLVAVPIMSGEMGKRDFPSKLLLKRASDMGSSDAPFDPVVHLDRK